jgi:phage shock protein PspC (stress-responsive transcriptional regulator)
MTERKPLGVYARLADKFGLDAGGVRILFVASIIFDFRSSIIFPLVKPTYIK